MPNEVNEIIFNFDELNELDTAEEKLIRIDDMLSEAENAIEDYNTNLEIVVDGYTLADFKARIVDLLWDLQQRLRKARDRSDVNYDVLIPSLVRELTEGLRERYGIDERLESFHELKEDIFIAIKNQGYQWYRDTSRVNPTDLSEAILDEIDRTVTRGDDFYDMGEIQDALIEEREQEEAEVNVPLDDSRFIKEGPKEIGGEQELTSEERFYKSELQNLGSGATRTTHAIDKDRVIKTTELAYKDRHKDPSDFINDMAQHLAEGIDPSLPEVLEKGLDYVVVERADTDYRRGQEIADRYEEIIEEVYRDEVDRGEDYDNADIEALRRIDEEYGSEFAIAGDYEQADVGDIVYPDNIGFDKEGKPVMIDAGSLSLQDQHDFVDEHIPGGVAYSTELVKKIFAIKEEREARKYELSNKEDVTPEERAELYKLQDIPLDTAQDLEDEKLEKVEGVLLEIDQRNKEISDIQQANYSVEEMVSDISQNVVINMNVVNTADREKVVQLTRKIANRYIKEYIIELFEKTI